ncbi:hypothetical protein Tco_1219577 [Tanacetum coccineum]
MDPVFSIGQKNILLSTDTLPGDDIVHPLLDKECMILGKVLYQLPSLEEIRCDQNNDYMGELSACEKIQADFTNARTIFCPKKKEYAKLYMPCDKFTHIKGESLHTFRIAFGETLQQSFSHYYLVITKQKTCKRDEIDVMARNTLLLALPGGTSVENQQSMKQPRNYGNRKSEVPTAQSLSTASGQVTTVSTEVATATFSHDTIYAYIATQQSGSQIKYEDITQIDDDDIKEMDIKWNMALLSMRADRFWKKTGKKITIQGFDVAGFMAEENEASENQALVAEEVVPTEFALMAMSSSSSDNEVEARLVEFKINESKFCEKIRVLERDLELKDYKIENLTNELEKVKKERDGIDSKLEKFVNSSKDLDQMLESQKSGKDKKGVGFDEYRAVPPPPAQVLHLLMPILSWTSLPEFVDNTVTDYTRPTPSVDVTNDVRSELDGNKLDALTHGGTSGNAVSIAHINFGERVWLPTVAAAKGNKGKAVKASARWIWKPKQISSEGLNVNGISAHDLQHNLIYPDNEPYDEGFGVHLDIGGSGKITGKTIMTGKLEFENVHLMRLLKKNRTIIEAARTMLADAKLLVTFWAEAVNTACFVQN